MLIDREKASGDRTSRTGKLATTAIGVLLVVVVAWSCGAASVATGAQRDEDAAAQKPADDENKKETALGQGQIRPVRELFVPARTEGLISIVLVRRGARVKQGDLLVRLDDRRAQLALKSATLEAKAAAHSPRSQRAVRKVAVDVAQLDLERTRITAPFDGVVTEVKAVPGGWVKPGERVCHIMQLARVKIDLHLVLRDTNLLKLGGREVLIETDAGAGKTRRFPGAVTYVTPVATPVFPQGSTLLVTVEADNPPVKDGTGWMLRPGAHAKVILPKK